MDKSQNDLAGSFFADGLLTQTGPNTVCLSHSGHIYRVDNFLPILPCSGEKLRQQGGNDMLCEKTSFIFKMACIFMASWQFNSLPHNKTVDLNRFRGFVDNNLDEP